MCKSVWQLPTYMTFAIADKRMYRMYVRITKHRDRENKINARR